MMSLRAQCLVLACGNPLREDDGVGPWLLAWAEERFRGDARVSLIGRQQWTPELALDIAEAASVLFVDCAVDSAPGAVKLVPVDAAAAEPGFATHHLGAAELLSLSKELYGATPRTSLLLTVGAGSLELREGFSTAVQAALPEACAQLQAAVLTILGH
ncbi:MAG: hydrogenase maturation protease [Terracidiphilus sp.]